MAGVIVELFALRAWDFSGLSNSQKATITLHRGLDVGAFTEARLHLLSHAHTLPSGATFTLRALVAAPSDEQPAVDFKGLALAQATLSGASPVAPTLITAAVLDNFGDALYIDLIASQGPSASTFTASLSAYLILKRRSW